MVDLIFDLQMFADASNAEIIIYGTDAKWKLVDDTWTAYTGEDPTNAGYITYDATSGALTYEKGSSSTETVAVTVTVGSGKKLAVDSHTGITWVGVTVNDGGEVSGAVATDDFIRITYASTASGATINGIVIKNTNGSTTSVAIMGDENLPKLAGGLSTTLANGGKVYTTAEELVTNTGTGNITVTGNVISGLSTVSTFTVGDYSYAYSNGKLTASKNNAAVWQYDIESLEGVTVTSGTGSDPVTGDTVSNGQSAITGHAPTSEPETTGIGLSVSDSTTGTVAAVTGTWSKTNQYVKMVNGTPTFSDNKTDALGYVTQDSKGVYTYHIDKANTSTAITNTDAWSVVGSKGIDYIRGNDAQTTIKAGAGNDNIVAGSQNIIFGEDGNDTLTSGSSATGVSLDGGKGDDYLFAQNAAVTLTGGDGADSFVLYDGAAGKGFISDKNYDIKKDVIVANGKLDALLTKAADDDNRKAAFKSNGTLSLGEDGELVFAESGVYAADVVTTVTGGGKQSQYFGWVGENGTTLDARTLDKAAILIGDSNDAADVIYGGTANDTIYAGGGDNVNGGSGKNQIHLGSGDRQVVTIGGGQDTIKGFSAGFDADTADEIFINGKVDLKSLTTSFDGNDVSVKAGSVSAMLDDVVSNADSVKVLVNGKKAVFVQDGKTVTVNSKTYADFYIGTKGTGTGATGGSAIDASGIEEEVKIDLSDTSIYKNITTVTGGASKTSLIGGAANEVLIAGSGRTSLYGGAGKDSLVSSSNDESNMFFMIAGAGNDSISGFKFYTADTATTSDVVNLSAVQSAKLVSGGVQLDVTDSDKVLIEGANENSAIAYKIGNSVGVAKIGSVSGANTFTYDAAVNYYGGGNKVDTLEFESGNADNHQIWLDGSKGVTYASIDVVDGSKAEGDLILAGDAEKNTISAGSGNASLWGGAGNSADSLVGGTGTDVFFYGVGEGNDVIEVNSDDNTVNLYNVTLNDLKISGQEITGSGVVLEFNNGEKLTVNTGSRDVKFALKDGSTYTAHQDSQSWT